MDPAQFEHLGSLYLGRPYDLGKDEATDGIVLVDGKDLVTHAVCVGMTGSGKTGLCVALLEEAALDGVPAIVIDPKGDLGNLLLTFPDLAPADFQPWVSADEAQLAGQTVDQFAAAQATFWREGLAKWGQDGARIARLKAAADFAIYTPGSDAGLPMSVLASLAPPPGGDAEALRDAVTSTASGVLALAGIEGDPLTSREHVLLATILQTAWGEGKSLDLPALVGQVQTPPFSRVGVLDLESFYPAKDRFALAMALNTVLASPGFDLWLRGEPLDVQRLLVGADGRPRISVLSIAHLSDAERMSFVTLVLNAVVAWVRAQPGTSSLRALLYMDEVFGYLPPVADPPSKRPLLTLLKQARASGLGVVLSTQNPVDLDYKALSNAGTWMIGRLQAERDKARLLDGLEGAAAGAAFDRAAMERTIAGLGKRKFLLHSVHEDAAQTFETRWCMSYLRGPLTRDQVRTLMAGRTAPTPVASAPAAAAPAAAPTAVPPGIPNGYVPLRAAVQGLVRYLPMLYGAASVHLHAQRSGVDETRDVALLVPLEDGLVAVDWAAAQAVGFAPDALMPAGVEGSEHVDAPSAALQVRSYARFGRDLATHLVTRETVTLLRCASLKQTSLPGESEADFRARLGLLAREQRDAAVEKIRGRYAARVATQEERVRRAEQTLRQEQGEATSGTAVSIGTTILGSILGGRSRSSSTILREVERGRRQQEDVGQAREDLAAAQTRLRELQEQVAAEAQAAAQADPLALPLEEVVVRPRKSDVDVRIVALAFAPHAVGADGSVAPAW